MKILLIFGTLLSINSFGAEMSCKAQAALDALEEVKDLVKYEISVSNKHFQNADDLEFSLGKMRIQKNEKTPKKIKSVIWVPIKIQKSGKTIWEVEQGFMYGDQCMRNRIAEYEAGIKVSQKLKKTE